jgi:hypothetical protein
MGKHQPALLGGVVIGVLSALPVVNMVNICCCLWVIVGGGLTVYLQQQRTPVRVETADAVIGGLLAGVIGAAIFVVLNALLMSVTGVVWQEEVRRSLEGMPEVPPEMRDGLMRVMTGSGVAVLTAAVTLPLFAVFSMLGALLGLAIFGKKTPPPAAQGPDVIQG